MIQVSPYHVRTLEADRAADHADVFHTETRCSVGRHIAIQFKIHGTGGRIRCPECQQLGKRWP